MRKDGASGLLERYCQRIFFGPRRAPGAAGFDFEAWETTTSSFRLSHAEAPYPIVSAILSEAQRSRKPAGRRSSRFWNLGDHNLPLRLSYAEATHSILSPFFRR